jgi:predicted ATPase
MPPQYLRDALDETLIRASRPAPTRWYVLTGAAASGKTTVLDLLAARGCATVPESARRYFDHEFASGRTLEQVRSDEVGLQRAIAALQRRAEGAADRALPMVLDRALPDSLTFYRVVGLDPGELLPACLERRYAGVFVLDRLPVRRARTLGPEDARSSAFLDEWLERDYRALGYDVVRVPVVPAEDRARLILDRIEGAGEQSP